MNRPVLILHLEDDARDAELVRDRLEQAGMAFELRVASNRADFEAALAQTQFDLILSDFSLPAYDGMAALAWARSKQPGVPFILLSGALGEEQAVDCVLRGATDYVLKQRLDRLVPAVSRALSEADQYEKRREAEAALRRNQAMLARTENIAHIGSWEWDVAKETMAWSDELFRIFQRKPADGAPSFAEQSELFIPEDMRRFTSAVEAAVNHGTPFELELRAIPENGASLVCLVRGNAEMRPKTGAARLFGSLQDITESKRAEEAHEKLEVELRQAQKMEAAGQLAGGVAHDFNNILQAILGYSQLLLDVLPKEDETHEFADRIAKSADRAATLTRQLLAFARKQTIAPRVFELNELVAGMLKMLRPLIGEDIDLMWQSTPDLLTVKMDPGQIDQILANLLVNARDAIGGVGRITIQTATADFDEGYCACHEGLVPGQYVMLSVSDDGSGMDKETQAHIFEPFFTTKELGKGTGLGLATVYGIVKQNGGIIHVHSEPGEGTTFKIYLPRHAYEEALREETGGIPERRTGTETVLLVEDEAPLLILAARLLEGLGYTVLSADRPSKALEVVREYPGDIHLLMTDVVMPGKNGRDLWREVSNLRPNLKCLFMSGYTSTAITHRGVLEDGLNFLQKPFTVEALADKLREVLDS